MLIRCMGFFALLAVSPLDASPLQQLSTNGEPPPLVVCTGEYALCASASCQPIPRYEKNALSQGSFQVESTMALCQCENKSGINVAQVPCAYRGDASKQTRVSTYSWADAADSPPKNLMHCSSQAKFTNCLNAPCQVDPLDPSKSVCTCPMTSTADSGDQWVTFGADCSASLCASKLWSGATQGAIDGADCCIDEYLATKQDGQPFTCSGAATSVCKVDYGLCPG